MKKPNFILFSFIMLFVLILTGCTTPLGPGVTPDPNEVVEINALQSSVTIKDSMVATFDFTSLFTITKDGEEVKVLDKYITHDCSQEAGTYTVTCTYNRIKASVEVIVEATLYEVILEVPSVTLNLASIKTYDFLSLFKATIDGEQIDITPDMIETDVKSSAGTYYYKVTNGNVSKSLEIIVLNTHTVEIINSYKCLEIPLSNISTFDKTSLFSLYVDGVFVKVTPDMITSDDLSNPQVGQVYNITLTYTIEEQVETSSTQIKVVEDDEIIITAKNIVTYPNSEIIDLTTLFTIVKGDEQIEVKEEYITGSVNYTSEGVNEITLTYEGLTSVATVEVKRGVVINYATSDVINVQLGTNIEKYNFANDFVVIINGLRFTNIPLSAIDTTNCDFNNPGRYVVTLTIAYNDKPLGISSVKFTYVTKTITYVVNPSTYELNVKEERVQLKEGTTEYNVFSNLNLIVNGKRQGFTNILEYASIITTYAEVVSLPLDFNKLGEQEVVIKLYIAGYDEPIEVSYIVAIESSLKVEVVEASAFVGDTIYVKDLFKVYDGDNLIETPLEAITGKVDTFKPGVYEIFFDYLGIKKSTKVIVYDNILKGTFKTLIKTIPVEEDDDEDYSDVGWDLESISDNQTADIMSTSTVIGDLVINEQGEIYLNNVKAKILRGIDESTMEIQVGYNKYMLYYQNGIVMLNPNNDIKLGFTDGRRPLIYFNEDVYDLKVRLVVNYSSTYVLQGSYTTYSIDVIKYTVKSTNEVKYFGMKVDLFNKTSSDTEYEVTFGEVTFSENFNNVVDNESTLYFNGDEYEIIMVTRTEAKVKKLVKTKEYANKVFTGTIDNTPSRLEFTEYEGINLYIGGEIICKLSTLDLESMKYGGIDYVNKTVHIYQCANKDSLAYKFELDLDTNTFTYVPKDLYYGKYETDTMYIFLDGYGYGVVNFKTSSYYTTPFIYSANSNIVSLRYLNTRASFEHGKRASFYVDNFMNILTLKEADTDAFDNLTFINKKIEKGGYVSIDTYMIGADADAIAKTKFYDSIHIVTKDGELSNEAKAKVIDTSKIKFSKEGFYQYTITLNIDGNNVTNYYAVQILEPLYESHPLAKIYGNGIIYKEYSFYIDRYGLGHLEFDGKHYSGMTIFNSDSTFSLKAENVDGQYININGSQIIPGLINIRCNGIVSFNDYYTTGSVKEAGTNSLVLREVKIGDTLVYLRSANQKDVCTITEIEFISGTTFAPGSIVKVLSEPVSYVLIKTLADLQNGLVFADMNRGTYTNEQLPQISLDGFGNCTYGTIKGTYKFNGSVVTLMLPQEVIIVKLNTSNHTYALSNIALDNTLLEGNTYQATYNFLCGDYLYQCQTTFAFQANGKVVVNSTSNEHDSGSDACLDDVYNPPFKGIGTYSVSGLKVTVVVNGYSFTFQIDDVVEVGSITCLSTSVPSVAHGYFKENTRFIKK